MKNIISTPHAPSAIGPYSQAVLHGSTLYCSGQIGLDPATMQLCQGLEAQVAQAFRNCLAVAKAAGFNPEDAVKCTLFLVNMADFTVVNEAMQGFFSTPYPARSTVAVAALPKGALFEIEAVFCR